MPCIECQCHVILSLNTDNRSSISQPFHAANDNNVYISFITSRYQQQQYDYVIHDKSSALNWSRELASKWHVLRSCVARKCCKLTSHYLHTAEAHCWFRIVNSKKWDDRVVIAYPTTCATVHCGGRQADEEIFRALGWWRRIAGVALQRRGTICHQTHCNRI